MVNIIKELLQKASRNPDVRELAIEIIAGSDEPIYAIYNWVKTHLYYLPDPIKADGDELEMFTSPIRLVSDYREGKTIAEDCDSHAMLTVALYRSIGVKANVVLVSYTGNGYDHAYAEVWSDQLARWITIDTTDRYPVGWEHPCTSRLVI